MYNIAYRSFSIDVEKQTYAGLVFWNECHEGLLEEEKKALKKTK
jgi:hypothetical protein